MAKQSAKAKTAPADTIEGTAVRRFSIADGGKFKKGAACALPAGQFADLEKVGLVKRKGAAAN